MTLLILFVCVCLTFTFVSQLQCIGFWLNLVGVLKSIVSNFHKIRLSDDAMTVIFFNNDFLFKLERDLI